MQAASKITPTPQTWVRPKSILVADDNYASRMIMRTLLEREGCDISFAHNGRVAVEQAKIEVFDLILMDLQMPILSGEAAASRIRQDVALNKNTIIFAVTAYSNASIKTMAETAGMNAVLLKPFRVNAMYQHWDALHQQQPDHPHCAQLTLPPTGPNPMGIVHSVDNFALLDSSVLVPLTQAASSAMLLRVIDRYWASAGELIEALQAELPLAVAGDTDSLDRFRKAAHAIKGASTNVGLLRSAHLAAHLQNAKVEALEGTLYNLMQCLSESRPELEIYINNATPPRAAARSVGKDGLTR